MAGYFAIMAGYGNGEGGGGGGVFLGFEKKIPKYPVEMCKGIKDLFLVIYRNHLHHLHPLWVIMIMGSVLLIIFRSPLSLL